MGNNIESIILDETTVDHEEINEEDMSIYLFVNYISGFLKIKKVPVYFEKTLWLNFHGSELSQTGSCDYLKFDNYHEYNSEENFKEKAKPILDKIKNCYTGDGEYNKTFHTYNASFTEEAYSLINEFMLLVSENNFYNE